MTSLHLATRPLPPLQPGRQRGVTLIGMMVGLLISLIVVAGMLMVYRTATKIAVEAGIDAQHDGQLAAGMLAAHIRIQGAGFRITNARYGEHLQMLAGSELTGQGRISGTAVGLEEEGDGIVWSSIGLDGSTECAALVPANVAGGLLYLEASCTNASSWGSLQWDVHGTLVETGEVGMIARQIPCKPFGIEKGEGGIQVSLFAANSVQRSTTGAAPSAHSVCLANFPSPVTSDSSDLEG